MAEKNKAVYAGFWIRTLASFIDSVLLSFVNFAVFFVILSAATGLGLNIQDESAQTLSLPFLIILVLAGIAVYFSYFAIFQSRSGYTFGKKLLGLRVVGLDLKPIKL